MSTRKEFGDFQTPERLAKQVVALVDELFGTPDLVIEPTAGWGTFLKASAERWNAQANYEGYEINRKYVDLARTQLSHLGVEIAHQDFFAEDWARNLARTGNPRILILGNPPWVTNSDLGQLGSDNLPPKSNYLGLRGLDARTGKSNFDIAECMLMRLLEALPDDGALAMLCKTMTARKVLRHFWKNDGGREETRLIHIDAKAEFNVAVDACLFFTTGKRSENRTAAIYNDLDSSKPATRFGFLDGDLVANIDEYRTHRELDGRSSTHTWRSGIKHDAAKVMEFTGNQNRLVNGLGETVEIEDEYLFPLLKSSDLGNGRTTIRKYVLVTQTHTGDDTIGIKRAAPKTWDYLNRHADILNGRKSSIYKNRPKFCIFGVGPYSFAPWKVAISGLYKKTAFAVVPPDDGRPVMIDDTCYSIPCHSKEEALLLHELLTSAAAQKFLNSLIFFDSKRPITIDVLRRLSLVELARICGKLDEFNELVPKNSESSATDTQMLLPLG